MTVYYNENDPYAAACLRNLIAAGLIAPGDVDDRSIEDVRPNDVRGYTQCHFFAGIGLWSYAARLAGIGDDQPLWTGSCPCQPFSAAGKGKGFADERHLWPAFFHLIRECRPDRVVGEQVASALAWYDLVSGDLEGEGYAVGSAIVGAHSVSAPHIRQRLYWVADQSQRRRREERADAGGQSARERAQGRAAGLEQCGTTCGLAHPHPAGRNRQWGAGLLDGERPAHRHDADGRGVPGRALRAGGALEHGLDDPECTRLEGLGGDGEDPPGRSLESGSAWAASVPHLCADGKWRPVPTEPALFPLADGRSSDLGGRRAAILKASGNAIVPQLAAAFLRAAIPNP